MAYSSSEGKLTFKDWLLHIGKPLNFTRFLDVGCGAGLYGDLIREVFGKDVHVLGVEAFKEYILRFNLGTKYDTIIPHDIRQICNILPDYDLVIMGDVLEHLTKQEAIDVVGALLQRCRFLWAALPMKLDRSWSTGYPQNPCEWADNPYNEHKHEWHVDELKETFKPMWIVPFVMTGTMLIEGELNELQ